MNKRGRPDRGRNIKLVCSQCGYVARTTRKWLETMGEVHCPVHGAMTVEGPLHGVPLAPQGGAPASPGYVAAAFRFLALVGCDSVLAACDGVDERCDGSHGPV